VGAGAAAIGRELGRRHQVTDDGRRCADADRELPIHRARLFQDDGMPLTRQQLHGRRPPGERPPSSPSGPRRSHGRESIRSDAGSGGATRRRNRSRWSGSSPTVTTRKSTPSRR
jgi:hypothetical protein